MAQQISRLANGIASVKFSAFLQNRDHSNSSTTPLIQLPIAKQKAFKIAEAYKSIIAFMGEPNHNEICMISIAKTR